MIVIIEDLRRRDLKHNSFTCLLYVSLCTDPAYGEGIYFAGTVNKAMKVWEDQKEEYLYFVEAEVLRGKSTSGKPGLILPPPVRANPQEMYDSVSGGPDIAVIFSGYQALPKYIITCKK